MDPSYSELQKAIYANEEELKRFRQIVINAVLAPNSDDDQLKEMEQKRSAAIKDSSDLNLKATAAISLLMQASEAFHTISHWQMYQKWNERSFFELYQAFESGRTKEDPSADWFQKSLQYFDDHVIPLCKDMQALGVFGKCADECAAFAATNRDLWSVKGEKISQNLLSKYKGEEEKNARAQRISQRQSLSFH